MAVGVPETEVFAAADRVLARGERPTVDRVRSELGRGSPARVGQILEQWWDALAKRLAGETALPELPPAVASAFRTLWQQAMTAATTVALDGLTAARHDLGPNDRPHWLRCSRRLTLNTVPSNAPTPLSTRERWRMPGRAISIASSPSNRRS
ncbi:MAG: DNA-binding protein [Xanthomonadales bacterium]|nr:DNA-binding protein [Xanthomonadales bacterium]